MRLQIQNLILNFISVHPGTRIADVIRGLPEVDRSSISSALTRLAAQGKITRVTDSRDRYEYTIAEGEVIPVISMVEQTSMPVHTINQQIITPEEWECRFSKAEELLEKGFPRRANQAFLELLDVTAETVLREKIVRSRDRCGSRPTGDSSTIAGHHVGKGAA